MSGARAIGIALSLGLIAAPAMAQPVPSTKSSPASPAMTPPRTPIAASINPSINPSVNPSIAPNLTAVSPVAPNPAPVSAEPIDPSLPKKDRDLSDKRARAALGPIAPVARVGAPPSPIINLFHRWTEEILPVPLTGPLPPAALQNRLLRDHYTNEAATMATKLVPAVVAAARSFRVLRADIVSGYRHPKYNLILRKKGHEVARDSEHSHGQAVDFRLPGVPTERLAEWALGRRMGGVGIYLQSQFVHIDVGKVRRWSGE
jgi:hypothetical protein